VWWFVASDICFDCLQHVLSLSRYAGPISRARLVSSPFSGLSRVHRTSKSRLAQGGKRRGHKKYNGLELDERTGGSRVSGSVARDAQRPISNLKLKIRNEKQERKSRDSVARDGEKDKARRESRRAEGIFFLRPDVTAETVTYKARERAKADRRRRRDHCVVEMIRLCARLGSQSQIWTSRSGDFPTPTTSQTHPTPSQRRRRDGAPAKSKTQLRSELLERDQPSVQAQSKEAWPPAPTRDISTLKIRKPSLNQPQHDTKDHRGRNPEQKCSICRFERPQQSPGRRHDEITVT